MRASELIGRLNDYIEAFGDGEVFVAGDCAEAIMPMDGANWRETDGHGGAWAVDDGPDRPVDGTFVVYLVLRECSTLQGGGESHPIVSACSDSARIV